MKVLKSILLLGTFVLVGCSGLSGVNASKRMVTFSEETLSQGKPEEYYYNSLNDKIQNFSEALLYELETKDESSGNTSEKKSYDFKGIVDRARRAVSASNSFYYKELESRFGRGNLSSAFIEIIVNICAKGTGLTIPRIVKRDIPEMINWLGENWSLFCPIIQNITLIQHQQ